MKQTKKLDLIIRELREIKQMLQPKKSKSMTQKETDKLKCPLKMLFCCPSQ